MVEWTPVGRGTAPAAGPDRGPALGGRQAGRRTRGDGGDARRRRPRHGAGRRGAARGRPRPAGAVGRGGGHRVLRRSTADHARRNRHAPSGRSVAPGDTRVGPRARQVRERPGARRSGRTDPAHRRARRHAEGNMPDGPGRAHPACPAAIGFEHVHSTLPSVTKILPLRKRRDAWRLPGANSRLRIPIRDCIGFGAVLGSAAGRRDGQPWLRRGCGTGPGAGRGRRRQPDAASWPRRLSRSCPGWRGP